MSNICLELLERNNLKPDGLNLLVPHQANLRIIESVAERLQLPMDRVALNIAEYGNTTAATIPSCLRHYEEKSLLKKGDLVLLAAFGAGFTWGATLLRY